MPILRIRSFDKPGNAVATRFATDVRAVPAIDKTAIRSGLWQTSDKALDRRPDLPVA